MYTFTFINKFGTPVSGILDVEYRSKFSCQYARTVTQLSGKRLRYLQGRNTRRARTILSKPTSFSAIHTYIHTYAFTLYIVCTSRTISIAICLERISFPYCSDNATVYVCQSFRGIAYCNTNFKTR